MRSDRRYIAVIPHHDSDDNNLPGPATPRLSVLSLAISLETLYFSPSISVSLSQSFLSQSLLSRRFASLFAFAHRPSWFNHASTWSLSLQSENSLTQFPQNCIACPTCTRLHLSIAPEIARCPLLSLLPPDATDISPSRMHEYNLVTHLPQPPFGSRTRGKKSAILTVAFRVSRLNDDNGRK